MLCFRGSSPLGISNLASLGPFDCGILKDEFRLGSMMGSSSVEDPPGEESQSSITDGVLLLTTTGSGTTTVSVLALPLASIVNITSVRDFGTGDSCIAVRLLARWCFTGEQRPGRGGIRPPSINVNTIQI